MNNSRTLDDDDDVWVRSFVRKDKINLKRIYERNNPMVFEYSYD